MNSPNFKTKIEKTRLYPQVAHWTIPKGHATLNIGEREWHESIQLMRNVDYITTVPHFTCWTAGKKNRAYVLKIGTKVKKAAYITEFHFTLR